MDTQVTCPECGRVIAPPGSIDDAARCHCSDERGPSLSVDDVPTRVNISVPIPDVTPAPHDDLSDDFDPAPAAVHEKKCYVCGASLEGRTRLKDHLGRYWCKECAAADKRAKRRENELRCADCGRAFPAPKLQYFQTDRVCSTCFKERERKLEKKILKANLDKVEKTHEWQSVKTLAIIAAILILLGTIGLFMHGF
jgi:hypothetical protein